MKSRKATAVITALALLSCTTSLKLIDSRRTQAATQQDLERAYRNIAELNYDLNEATRPIEYSDRKYLGEFKLTWYDACIDCCGKTDGITASGAKVCDGVTVAVDPKVIPLGTYIYIEGVGYRVAQDTGGAIKGNKIDVYVHSHDKALEKGVATASVWKMKGAGNEE